MGIVFPCGRIADRADCSPSHIIILYTFKSNRRVIVPIQRHLTIAGVIILDAAAIDVHISGFDFSSHCLGYLVQLIFCSRSARDDVVLFPFGVAQASDVVAIRRIGTAASLVGNLDATRICLFELNQTCAT